MESAENGVKISRVNLPSGLDKRSVPIHNGHKAWDNVWKERTPNMKQFWKKLVLCVLTLALCCNLVPMAFAAGPGYYTVYFESQGGVCDVMQLPAYKMGDVYRLTTIPTPVLDGYRFDGWYINGADNDPDGTQLGTGTDIKADTTVYARWTATGQTSTVEAPRIQTLPAQELSVKKHLGTVLIVGMTVAAVALVVSQAS